MAEGQGTITALRAHRVRMLGERVEVGLKQPTKMMIWRFTGVDGSAIHPGQFSDRFDRLLKSSRLPRIRSITFDTHSTLSLRAGIQPKVVSDRRGHSNIAVTLGTYSYAITALQEDAAT